MLEHRLGAVGREFEVIAQMFFRGQGIELQGGLTVPAGVRAGKEDRKSDLFLRLMQ